MILRLINWFRFGCVFMGMLRDERKKGESLAECMRRLIRQARMWREFVSTTGEFFAQLVNELSTSRANEESPTETMRRVFSESAQWRALGASKPEPVPQNQNGPALWPLVIADLEREAKELGNPIYSLVANDALERHEFGVKKYGVPIVAANGRDALRDAYQEALDQVVYLAAAVSQTATDGQVHTLADRLYQDAIKNAVNMRGLL